MGTWCRGYALTEMVTILLLFLSPLVCGEQMELLQSLASLAGSDPLLSDLGLSAGNSALKGDEGILTDALAGMMKESSMKESESFGKPIIVKGMPLMKPKYGMPLMKPKYGMPLMKPKYMSGKILKVGVPLKKVAVKKAVGAKMLVPKVKVVTALKKKPKVYTLKPIVHIIEKPVPVFHKVPIPKKVKIPKFYPVMKPILVPKIIPVPFKVPVKKIIPKIVKIPKAIPIPKFFPVKKYIPIGIPYPVPKFYKVPISKPVPYAKYIPIPIPKKVPKFIPVPIKKIIKVPKPYYVPIKVPYITTSYMKTPMVVKVPDVKKTPFKLKPKPMKGFKEEELSFIEPEGKEIFKVKDSGTDKKQVKPLM